MNTDRAIRDARQLVVEEGSSYAQAAEATGLSVSTIQKAGADGGWQAARQRYTLESAGYSDKVRRLKRRALDLALLAVDRRLERASPSGKKTPLELLEDSQDPLSDVGELIKEWRSLETAYPEHRYQPAERDPEARKGAMLEALELIVDFAAGEDPELLALLQPHLQALGARIQEACGG